MTSVLVTGAAGYIGTTLIPLLLQEGFSVTGIDNFYYGQHYALNHILTDNRFRFVYKDLTKPDKEVEKLIQHHDTIINLAAIVGMNACDANPGKSKLINEIFVKETLLPNLSSHQMVLFPNTNSGYGKSTGEVFCTETTPMAPISLYGITKCEAERAILEHPQSVVYRLATVCGVSPRMRCELLLNWLIQKAVNNSPLKLYDRHFKRNLVHIQDVAEGFIFAINNIDEMRQQVYNLGNDYSNLSKEEMVNIVKGHFPNWEVTYDDETSDPDQRNYIVSNQKLADCGFRANTNIHEIIPELIKFFTIIKGADAGLIKTMENYKNS